MPSQGGLPASVHNPEEQGCGGRTDLLPTLHVKQRAGGKLSVEGESYQAAVRWLLAGCLSCDSIRADALFYLCRARY